LRPKVDVHYRYDSQNDSYITYLLCKERGKENSVLYEQLKKYVKDPDFCRLSRQTRKRGGDIEKKTQLTGILVFYYPLKGVLLEVLEYLIHEDDYTPLEAWFETLRTYIHDEPKLE
jgi:hypothetical protein